LLPLPGLPCLNGSLQTSHIGTILVAMRIIAVSYLRAFWVKHPDAEQALKSWVDEVKHAAWKHPADIKGQYRNASVLKNRRVVFNIKGNDYRLVVSVAYRYQAVYVKFVGTHVAYDAIDAETIDLEL
jgi:mRNA interferase HigB